ncbi:MAG: GNAT family N-acetyltransferase [Anaerococcus sp.]
MRITNKVPSAKEYIDLRLKAGMTKKTENKAKIALDNSLFIVSLWENNQLIGFGRIVGDGGIAYIVSDIMVDPDYQKMGYGSIIMTSIDEYFKEHADKQSFICLIADKPADKLYQKFGFEDVGPKSIGMKKNLSDFFD